MLIIGGRTTKHPLTASWASFGIALWPIRRQFAAHWPICANLLATLVARSPIIDMYMRIVPYLEVLSNQTFYRASARLWTQPPHPPGSTHAHACTRNVPSSNVSRVDRISDRYCNVDERGTEKHIIFLNFLLSPPRASTSTVQNMEQYKLQIWSVGCVDKNRETPRCFTAE